MRPRRIPEDMRQRIQHVAIQRRALPSDKELAAQAGCSIRWIQKLMEEFVRNHVVSMHQIADRY